MQIKASEIATKTGAIPPQYSGKVYGYWGRVTAVTLYEDEFDERDNTITISYADGSYSPCQSPNMLLEIRD